MRCYCCNAELSDFEATRKSVVSGDYLDICNECFYTISDDIDVFERDDLKHNEDDKDAHNE
jgi:hypothetical protein